MTGVQKDQQLLLERIAEAKPSSWATPRSYTWISTVFDPVWRLPWCDRVPDGTLILDLDGQTMAIGPTLGKQLFVSIF